MYRIRYVDRFLLIILVDLIQYPETKGVRDFTIQKGGRGCPVTSAVIQKIQNSGIFKPDNFVLSRISIVLNFGQNRSNFSDRGRGLFAITPLMWTNAGNAATFLGLSELIRQHFCFDLVTSEYDAVEVPIKAGVMLALLLERQDRIPYRFEIKEQAEMVSEIYGLQDDPAFSKLYVERSELLVGYVLRAYCSLLCYPQKTDLLLAVDGSGFVLPQNWLKVVDFLSNYTQGSLALSDRQSVRVALIFFNSEVNVHNFEEFLRPEANNDPNVVYPGILQAVTDYVQNASDFRRAVHDVLDSARDIFSSPTSGSRIDDHLIAKNLVILTSGEPDDLQKTIEARLQLSKKVPDVNVFAIGMHENASLSTLESIAQSKLRVYSYNSFDYFRWDQDQVFSVLCSGFATVPLIRNETRKKRFRRQASTLNDISSSSIKNKFKITKPDISKWRYFKIAYEPNSVMSLKVNFDYKRVNKAKFIVHMFFSYGDVRPTAMIHDFMVRVPENTTKVILIRPTEDVLLDTCNNDGVQYRTSVWPQIDLPNKDTALTVGIMPLIYFADQQSTQQFDYMSLAYGFEGIQRDPNAENPGEKLIKTKETVMMNLMILDDLGLGGKASGENLSVYGEEPYGRSHFECPLWTCQQLNYIPSVKIETVTKNASLSSFEDYESLINGVIIPEGSALTVARARFDDVSRAVKIIPVPVLFVLMANWTHLLK